MSLLQSSICRRHSRECCYPRELRSHIPSNWTPLLHHRGQSWHRITSGGHTSRHMQPGHCCPVLEKVIDSLRKRLTVPFLWSRALSGFFLTDISRFRCPRCGVADDRSL
ncbi:hypothetical protein DOTSEDRAFT_71161 [Dothistroma septosporum NZE10]|uniref:Uncharacterized protein n=1 Tax=Dothistroma septosporum (strain NZE10 / CBS 128990) TaxID=675120 RepID=N1PSE0_DOTSN|nr:hypothetical protein DOTSEDRAFT_71161 [Dothistroma septosporum NZE10]